MVTKKQINDILLHCRGGVHQKTNKAVRKKQKQDLKKLLPLNLK